MSQSRFDGDMPMNAAYDPDAAGNVKGEYGNLGFVLVEPGEQFDTSYAVWSFIGTDAAGKWERSEGRIPLDDLAKRYICRVRLPLSTMRLSLETINAITDRGTLHQLGDKKMVALFQGKVVAARPVALRAEYVLADVFAETTNRVCDKGVKIPYEHVVAPTRQGDTMGLGVTALTDLSPEQRADLASIAATLNPSPTAIHINVEHLRRTEAPPQPSLSPDAPWARAQQTTHSWSAALPKAQMAEPPGTELTVMLHQLGTSPIGPLRVRLVEPGLAQVFCASVPTLDGRTMTWPPPAVLDGRPMNYEVLSTAKPASGAEAHRSWTTALTARQSATWYSVDTWGTWLDYDGESVDRELHVLRSWICSENHTDASDRVSALAMLLDVVMRWAARAMRSQTHWRLDDALLAEGKAAMHAYHVHWAASQGVDRRTLTAEKVTNEVQKAVMERWKKTGATTPGTPAKTRRPFNGICDTCGVRGHKARFCQQRTMAPTTSVTTNNAPTCAICIGAGRSGRGHTAQTCRFATQGFRQGGSPAQN
eukprot:PhM_4_TR11687/c3_g1_i8/m.76291